MATTEVSLFIFSLYYTIQVSVDVPDVRGRTEILKVHASNKKFDSDVSLDVIAMRTPGFSGADLANLLNEAAILAGRRGKTAISSKEVDDSIDRIVAGMEGTVMTDGKSKSLVSYHEVGHAICGYGSSFSCPACFFVFLFSVANAFRAVIFLFIPSSVAESLCSFTCNLSESQITIRASPVFSN